MKYYVVDSFTDTVFKGNPAGVCFLDNLITDEIMQSIAAENNLAETAFLVKGATGYDLRWFTPECEIDLCGHATLASAFILFSFVEMTSTQVAFSTKSGILTVKKEKDKLIMNFPSRKPVITDIPAGLENALGAKILEAHRSRDLLAVLENEDCVKSLKPDFRSLEKFKDYFGIIVTSKGESCDFVSRYFAPNAGIKEDPVTGSAHSTLIPFWSERLNQKELTAKQLSRRGGSLYCRDCGDRVEIGGQAKLYLSGEIMV